MFYKHIPVWAQHIAVSAKGLSLYRKRYGHTFKKALIEYESRNNWSKEKIFEFQKMMLRIALERASKTKYYSRVFSNLGACWQDFINYENFRKLPIITKRELQSNIDDFRCRPPVSSDCTVTTSGTTGTSLALPISSNVEPDQWAVWWRYRGWHDLNLKTPCALFASAPIVPSEANDTPYRINWFAHEVRFSIFHISEETASLYVEALNRFRSPWIHGNPTAIALLANAMNKNGMSLNYKLDILTVGSENLLPWQVEEIKKAFDVTPIQHYGLCEAVSNISECEAGNLHVDEDYSFTEFIEDKEANSYRIIGTNFSNSAISLLRYDTGDLAHPTTKECTCGRPGRIVDSLDGRLTDYITLPGGNRVASLAGPFHATPGLVGAQLYQDVNGALKVRYIPDGNWSREIQSDLENRLRIRVGNEIPISFERVEHIERTARGKSKLVISDYQY